MGDKKIYHEEFVVAKEAVQMINEKFKVELGEDEAGFIAFHFVNAQLNNGMNTVAKITQFVTEILSIITYQLKSTVDEETLTGFRFLMHLKFLRIGSFLKMHMRIEKIYLYTS